MEENNFYEYPSLHHRLAGYPYRVWIFSLIITPLLEGLVYLVLNKTALPFSAWYIIWYLLTLPLLIAYSFPSMVIYMLLFWNLIKSKLDPLWIKIILEVS